MTQLFRRALAALALTLLAGPLLAAGTVQLVLEGQVHLDGGRRVEFQAEAGGRSVAWRTQFANGTSAGDVMAYLARRLKGAGIGHYRGIDKAQGQPQVLFIENVERISVRFGGGLTAVLHSMDEVPTGFTVEPPRRRVDVGSATVEVYVTIEDARTGEWSAVTVAAEMGSASSSATIAATLDDSALARRLKSEQPTTTTWAVTGSHTGGQAVAMTARVYGYADWALVMDFQPLVQDR